MTRLILPWAVIVLCVAVWVGVARCAMAAPPPEGSEDAQILGPYSQQLQKAYRDDHPGWQCCSIADGAPVDTQIVGDRWQVRFRNARFPDAPKGWIDVPPEAVLHGWVNPRLDGIAWWYNSTIRCFAPPSTY